MKAKRLSHDELEQYPIGHEEAWPVGEHRVSTFDLAVGADRLIGHLPARPSLLYVDPPWGAGLATGFRTKAGVGGKADFPALMRTLGRVVVTANAAVSVVEQGDRWVAQMLAAFREAGVGAPFHTVPGTYAKTRPMTYVIIATDAYVAEMVGGALRGVNDDVSPGVVMDALGLRPGEVVFDPMCGRGRTAGHAVQRGLRFVGNELAPYRAASTIAVLNGAPTP